MFVPLEVHKPVRVVSFREAIANFRSSLATPCRNTLRAEYWNPYLNDVESIAAEFGQDFAFSDIEPKQCLCYSTLSAVGISTRIEQLPIAGDEETLAAYQYENVDGDSYHQTNTMITTGVAHYFDAGKLCRQVTVVLYAHLKSFEDAGGKDYYARKQAHEADCIKNFHRRVFWMSWHDMQVIEGVSSSLYLTTEFGKMKDAFLEKYWKAKHEAYLALLDTELIFDGPFHRKDSTSGAFRATEDLSSDYDEDEDSDHPNAKIIKDVMNKFGEKDKWVVRLAYEVRKHGGPFVEDRVNNDAYAYLAKLDDRILVAHLERESESDADYIQWYWF